MIGIKELLAARGLDLSRKIKLVRHQDGRFPLYQMMVEGHLDTYQKFQSRLVFNCEFIVSFIGLAHSTSRLLGVYEVGDRRRGKTVKTPNYPYRKQHNELADHYYELTKLSGFEDLEQRVIIDWGKSTRSWHQWLHKHDKEVVQILPAGFAREWPGYLDFIVPFAELERIIRNPDANHEWHTRLSSVGGIYLITSGSELYVGSAGGGNGILSRWHRYVTTGGHGGNVLLRGLVEAEPNTKYGLHFSILRTLPLATPMRDVIEVENLCKEKLGSRAHGLNVN